MPVPVITAVMELDRPDSVQRVRSVRFDRHGKVGAPMRVAVVSQNGHMTVTREDAHQGLLELGGPCVERDVHGVEPILWRARVPYVWMITHRGQLTRCNFLPVEE